MTDEMRFATHARIQHAAFEAAYMDLSHPDPASRGFAVLVLSYVERLWAEHRAGQGDKMQAGLISGQKLVVGEFHSSDGPISWSTSEQPWERPY